MVLAYTYDADSRITAMNWTDAGSQVGDLEYTYGKDGRVIAKSGSFASVQLPAPVSGNTFNADNEMTAFNGTTLSYDADGHLTSDGTNSYVWDARGHLTAVAGPNVAAYQYDAFGLRVQNTLNGVMTQYLYDGANPVEELDGASPPNVVHSMLTGLGIDEYFARTNSSGTMSSYLTDALGSTLALADSSGALTTEYTYEPFGATMVSGSSTNPFQFTGRENDGTGLYYYRARYYSPTLGRFISQDPLGFGSHSMNLYTYALDAPSIFLDPAGLEVSIVINRTTYTSSSTIGTITVTSTVTNNTFSGYTLENANPPNPDLPVPPGTYTAFVRKDHSPNRVELEHVPNASNIQIHSGNSPRDVKGCFAVGTTSSRNWVGHSITAMKAIDKIISVDGTGKITVTIKGGATAP